MDAAHRMNQEMYLNLLLKYILRIRHLRFYGFLFAEHLHLYLFVWICNVNANLQQYNSLEYE